MGKTRDATEPVAPAAIVRAEAACARQLGPNERVFIRHVGMLDMQVAVAVARTLAKCGLACEIEGPVEWARTDFVSLYAANRGETIKVDA